jgi:hypothetical protein
MNKYLQSCVKYPECLVHEAGLYYPMKCHVPTNKTSIEGMQKDNNLLISNIIQSALKDELHIYNEEQVPYNLWASFKTVLFSK